MTGITSAAAQLRLQQYMDAEAAVLQGQRYEIAGRMLQRADLKEIRAGIDYWERKAADLERSAYGRSRAVVPRPVW